MSFAIITDSTCDLTLEEAAAIGVTMVPLTIDIAGGSYLDQVELSSARFYELMAASEDLPRSACPKPFDFMEVYKQQAAQGADGVLVLNIAETLSGTVGAARLAAKDVDVPVIVIDSMGCTVQLGLLIQKAVELRDAGKNIEEAASAIENYVKDTRFLVVCDTLENLLKGGRLAQEDADTASKLNIKPIFTFDGTGRIKPFDKARGMNGARKAIIAALQKEAEQKGKLRIAYGHCDAPKEAEKLKVAVAEAGIEFEDAGTYLCGATIGTHLGAGALCVACASA